MRQYTYRRMDTAIFRLLLYYSYFVGITKGDICIPREHLFQKRACLMQTIEI